MINRKQKFAVALVITSILIGVLIWAYSAYIFQGSPEEEAWAPLAGFFKGLIIGGFCFVLSLINLFVAFKNSEN